MQFQSAHEDDIQTFSYGQCMWFALAAHERTGWPLEVVLDDGGFIGHAWVRMPDGDSLDVAGRNGADDFIEDPSAVRAVSAEELVALAGGERDLASLEAAHRVLDGMGLPKASQPSRRRPKP